MIYASDRMERRFQLFEKLALRSLLQQNDQDFRCIFLITKSFPQDYRERLEKLVAPLQGGIVMEKPFMPQYRAIRRRVMIHCVTQIFSISPVFGWMMMTCWIRILSVVLNG